MLIKGLDPKFYGENEVENSLSLIYPRLTSREALLEAVYDWNRLNSRKVPPAMKGMTAYEKCALLDKLFDQLNEF